RPQYTNAGRSEHLVAGEGKKVAAEVAHVHRQVRHALRTVQKDQRAVRVGKLRELLYRVDRAEHVRHVRHGYQSRFWSNQRARCWEVEDALVRNWNRSHLCAGVGGNHLPGQQIAVVLRLRDDDLVAGLEISLAPGAGREIDRLRRIPDEDHRARVRRADKARDLDPNLFVLRRRLFGEDVDAAMDVRVGILIIPRYGLDDRAWFLRGRGIIQVDQWLTVDLAREDRKIGPHALHVQHRMLLRLRAQISTSTS